MISGLDILALIAVVLCALATVLFVFGVRFCLLARRHYRGPTGLAGWIYNSMVPFAELDPRNYTDLGARYMRRWQFCFFAFMGCVLLGIILAAIRAIR